MKTPWGEKLDKNAVLQEYPRPQLKRESYINLNGAWQYAITASDSVPESMDGEIIVPFSPECELSGVMRTLKPDEALWYSRHFDLPFGFNKGRVLLHFGAVDQIATVYINGHDAGTHIGGYNAFTLDITPYIKDENVITVKVIDYTDTSYHSRGKQKTKRGGIWYTPQSGIWQTVWAESVPEEYIQELVITPLFDESSVEITAYSNKPDSASECIVRVGDVVAYGMADQPIRMSMAGFRAWSPESPYLYDMDVRMANDSVRSYFAMRKFSASSGHDGKPRLMLNNKPYFHNGVLDQGYWPDGLYTAPSDEAIINDILSMKALGYNTLRKHIKVEPMRFYYHCDRLGMLVWQDMPNGGELYKSATVSLPLLGIGETSDTEHNYARFGRHNKEGRIQYHNELREMIIQLYNCPCIAMWVPFNEGWGQFDSEKAVETILQLDTTRTIDHASGWHDQGVGDVKSLHVYFKPFEFKPDKLGRAVVLSEFGGFNRRINGHSFNKKDFGYKRMKTDEAFTEAFKALYKKEIAPAYMQGLSAAIYTQLSDVEDELNGLLTYDRKVEKLPVQEIRELFSSLFADIE